MVGQRMLLKTKLTYPQYKRPVELELSASSTVKELFEHNVPHTTVKCEEVEQIQCYNHFLG
jgi:hypothetical protein